MWPKGILCDTRVCVCLEIVVVVTFCNKVISKQMARFPLTITSPVVLEEVIGKIDDSYICVGNPDSKFEPIALSRNGEFTNARGKRLLSFHITSSINL